MIKEEARLRAHTEEVAAEVIDGEAVLINLNTGTYFTMDGVGAVMWSMIERGYSLAEMSDRLASSYAVDRQKVLVDLQELAGELLAHSLVVVVSETSAVQSGEIAIFANHSTYHRPTLRCYTDMAEVLALDPPLPALKEDS